MKRTTQQNKSYWLWLTLLSQELNDSGQSMGDGKLIRVPLYFTPENLHEYVVKPYLNALYPEKDSTTKLTTVEMQDLYQRLDQIIAERSQCSVPWPSEDSLYWENAS